MIRMMLPTVVLPIVLMVGCGESSYSDPTDLCNDQAWDECAGVAWRECRLTGTSSDNALRACRPFAQCEDAAFDACMDEHD
jgi:hypothetical protein